jgi:membrane protease YdiL (CAAX protease family)
MIKSSKGKFFTDIAWSSFDILAVFVVVIGGAILTTFSMFLILGEDHIPLMLIRYVSYVLGIFLPLFWIKKKYALNKEALGLKKDISGFTKYISFSLVLGIVYSISADILFFESMIFKIPDRSLSIINIILAPITIRGFASIVRKKIGIISGIAMQAIIFSFMHIKFSEDITFVLIDAFLIGIILGVLYEKTGSIYPSIFCHSAINYLSITIL